MIKALLTLIFLPFYIVIIAFKIAFLPFTIFFSSNNRSEKNEKPKDYSDGFEDGLLTGWFLFDD